MLRTVFALLAALPLIDPADLVRVDVPDHPDAIARSATGSLLDGPPDDGTPWRPASIPATDEILLDGWPVAEAVEVTNADLWHADGITGEGVRVAVFDIGWYGGAADWTEIGALETHDCWVSPTCDVPIDVLRPNLTLESGHHGLACAETIHDLAPGAELHAVRVNSFTMLENAVDWAVREGIDLISMSMSYYNASFYDGTGPHAALMEKLEANDVLMVTSAGNNGLQHWEGPWADGNGDGLLDGDGDDGLYVWLPEGRTTIYVAWNQYGSCGQTDLDAWVVDDDRILYGVSDDVQEIGDEDCSPVERVSATVPATDWYRLEVRHRRGTLVDLHLDVLTRAGQLLDPVPARSVTDPGAHPFAFAVGAVRADGYWDNGPEGFSSWGPNHAGDAKPEIAGPDGLSTSPYGPVGFYGTSASTPAVAALIALVMQDDPSLGPREAATKLQGWARDAAPASAAPDPRWGAGKARLPVRDPERPGCGRRPLIMPLVLLPVFGFRRRRRSG